MSIYIVVWVVTMAMSIQAGRAVGNQLAGNYRIRAAALAVLWLGAYILYLILI
jgi:hypothetical protein